MDSVLVTHMANFKTRVMSTGTKAAPSISRKFDATFTVKFKYVNRLADHDQKRQGLYDDTIGGVHLTS